MFTLRSHVAADLSKYGGSFMKIKTYKVKALRWIEMLVVLLIISVLLLLFVPNLTKQKDSVKETGNAAVVQGGRKPG